MSIKFRVPHPDSVVKRIGTALQAYDDKHEQVEIEIYRRNSVSVRIRVLNPEFAGKSPAEREDEIWAALERLPEDVVADISLLLLLTPEEATSSLASADFDTPLPSKL